MFVIAKLRKIVVNKVACSIKYLLITERHGNMNARLLNIIFTHIYAVKIFTELSFFYIALRKRTLYVSIITIYFMRYVFIGSKCPNVSGVQGKSLHTTQ